VHGHRLFGGISLQGKHIPQHPILKAQDRLVLLLLALNSIINILFDNETKEKEEVSSNAFCFVMRAFFFLFYPSYIVY